MIGRVSLAMLALAVAGCLGLSAGKASASHVSCGDTITADTTLDSDLIDCPGDGLVIGANDITVDLNGHTISSARSTDAFSAGVNNGGGYDGVTMENGIVKGFRNPGGSPFSAGLVLTGADDNVVRSLLVRGNLRGIVVEASSGDRFRSNKVKGDTVSGISLDRVDDVHVVENSLPGSSLEIGHSSHGMVRDNVVRGAPLRSISLGDSNRNRIVENRVARIDITAMQLIDSDRNLIARNQLRGFSANSGLGLALVGGSEANALRHNAVRHVTVGIQVGGPHTLPGSQQGNLLIGNFISDSGRGILVGHHHSGHTTLESNRANDNEDNGITIRRRSSIVTHNVARRNGGHGIAAVAGTTDGGGNIASGNLTSPQCVNIKCRAS